ncbi:MAG: hypothetical protein JJU37_07135 [Balneolaceae bacterium]|nr:hypothetical protein [Balneolaceae bacterium]
MLHIINNVPKIKALVCPVLFISILLISCSATDSEQFFDGGNGTKANPYQVSNVEQLQEIGEEENLDMHFIQVADINASPSAEFQNGSGWRQIGFRETPFTGTYNGNGYVIRDLKLHAQRGGPSNGVWGYVKNGRIENVVIDNIIQLSSKSMNDQHQFASFDQSIELLPPTYEVLDLSEANGYGGMVGFNDGGEIINCIFHGRVDARMGAPAGFVGINTGLVENSHFKGTAGGFSGIGFTSINTGIIIDSSTEIRTSGMGAHGFVSINYGEIIRSSAHVDLYGSNGSTGFASNNNGGRIESSFVTGEIGGNRIIAGFSNKNSGIIKNSYSNVNVSIRHEMDELFSASGFVYENTEEGLIENSYATGSLTSIDGEAELATVIIENRGAINSLYWDLNALEDHPDVLNGSNEGATGLTTAQMTGPAAEQSMPGFDWVNVWRTTQDGYPVLRWEDE